MKVNGKHAIKNDWRKLNSLPIKWHYEPEEIESEDEEYNFYNSNVDDYTNLKEDHIHLSHTMCNV
ncbi:MAG: hypothetical protein M0Q38_12975 [Bacteroidales bacterium]|jgi:hypothetical protein|nr:hypothetical protein [Bacteroidales bacterium]